MPNSAVWRLCKHVLLAIFVMMICVGCSDKGCNGAQENKEETVYQAAAPAAQNDDDDTVDDDTAVEEDGCIWKGVEYVEGQSHPETPCVICRLQADGTTLSWVSKAENAGCNDGDYCNGPDQCVYGVCQPIGEPVEDCADDDDDSLDDDVVDDDDDDRCVRCLSLSECRDELGFTWTCVDDPVNPGAIHGCCIDEGDDDVTDDDTIDDDDDDDVVDKAAELDEGGCGGE